MKARSLLETCRAWLLLILCCSQPVWAESSAAGGETARLGLYMKVVRDLNRADVRAVLTVWAEELTHRFQVPSEVFFYADIDELRKDFDSGGINMVIADAMAFVRHFKATELADGFTTRLATDASLLLLSRSGATRNGLAGKRVAQVDSDEISMTYLETLCLRQYRRTCRDVPLVVVPVANHHQALTRLLFGQADLALVNRHGYDLAIELNPQLARVGQVVHELAFDTQYFGFFSARVDPAFRQFALRSIPLTHSNVRGRQMLAVLKVAQLVAADPAALQPFYELEREYQQLRSKARGKAGRK